jgi:hypothetical protein
VPEQPRLDVLRPQRLPQQDVVTQVDHARGEVVARAPVPLRASHGAVRCPCVSSATTMVIGYPRTGLANRPAADPGDVIDDFKDYLTAVTSRVGVGLESCCWGGEPPTWAYVALDWRLAGRDVALLWDSRSGWSVATDPEIGCDLDEVARLEGDPRPAPAAVAEFVAALRAGIPAQSAGTGLGDAVPMPSGLT